MTRYCMCILVLSAFCFTARSDVAVGADIYTRVLNEREHESNQERKTNNFDLRLIPAVILTAGRVEIVPRAGISFGHSKQVVEDSDGNETTAHDNKSVGWGVGCGVYPRLINGKVFRLSIGPDGWFWFRNPEGDDNNTLRWQGTVPVNTDFVLGSRVFLRVSPRLVTVSFERRNRGGDNYDTEFNILTLATSWSLTAGLFFQF